MTQNASKQGKLDSSEAIFLFIFVPCTIAAKIITKKSLYKIDVLAQLIS